METNPKILIVDDDPDDVEFFCQAIEKMYPDWECISTRNGKDCLDTLQNNKNGLPEMIFMDLNMPVMDGKTCLSALKKHRDFRNIPVVIYSTSSNLKEKKSTLNLGASYFLTKPVSFELICDKVKRVIDFISSSSET